jgi:PAS domain S-box-containing protein
LVNNGRQDLVDTASLLVSEVVTNALLHTGTPMDVVAGVTDRGLRVEVHDGSGHFPVRRRYAATAGTGRGMMMLEALVDEWGVSRTRAGKFVWFELSSADSDEQASAPQVADEGARPGRSQVRVTLFNVPLLLHTAWQEHAAALLREYLLASMDEDASAIQVHADATDALALLEESIPHAEVAIVPDELMRDATEPFVSHERVDLDVPSRSVPHFRTLGVTIEAALEMAHAGLFLTPPTQPELQDFRRWACSEVDRQAEGETPVPFTPGTRPWTPEPAAVAWDATEVVHASTGMVAVDDANRIIAASPSVLDLLGYDDASELVGSRITTIMPERYRQAHVAGFTMYFLTGRQPLLARPVAVPALRRDGSEVMVELLIEARQVDTGREVFVSTVREIATG